MSENPTLVLLSKDLWRGRVCMLYAERGRIKIDVNVTFLPYTVRYRLQQKNQEAKLVVVWENGFAYQWGDNGLCQPTTLIG